MRFFLDWNRGAYFPGGEKSWASYLARRLNINRISGGYYTVRAQFIVDKDGRLCNVEANIAITKFNVQILDYREVRSLRLGAVLLRIAPQQVLIPGGTMSRTGTMKSARRLRWLALPLVLSIIAAAWSQCQILS